MRGAQLLNEFCSLRWSLRLRRGPEVESWYGADEGTDPAELNNWPLLPFMALSDGAHA
jgi:hypothetical protein